MVGLCRKRTGTVLQSSYCVSKVKPVVVAEFLQLCARVVRVRVRVSTIDMMLGAQCHFRPIALSTLMCTYARHRSDVDSNET